MGGCKAYFKHLKHLGMNHKCDKEKQMDRQTDTPVANAVYNYAAWLKMYQNLARSKFSSYREFSYTKI